MEYRILGPLQVSTGGRAGYIGGPREHRTLVTLLLNANRVVGVDRLIDVLWGERAPRTAATQIRNTISTLRRHLPPDGESSPVSRSGGGFTICVRDGDLDAQVFQRHVERGRALIKRGDLAAAAGELGTALELWRGPALGGLGPPVLDVEALALEEQRLACIEQRVELDLELGRHHEVIAELARLVHAHPLRERLTELQVIALHRSGRRQDALDAFAAARVRLADHAGLDPGPELVRLQRAVLRGEDVPGTPIGPVTARVTWESRPAQLPSDVPAFIGRAAILKVLDSLLESPNRGNTSAVIVSSIAGTAGVGKTALALHWAHRVRHRFADGQLYVNLRGFGPDDTALDPRYALRGFLDALGVPPQRMPAEPDAQAGLYRSLLADRHVLVVLDNARDAEQVRPLLPGAPGCLVVVTSRNQLSGLVAAAGAHPVTVDLLSADEAHELLTARLGSARVAAEPVAVGEIIAGCAGLPLALVIVAAHAAAKPELSLADLAVQLGRASIDALASDDPLTDVRTVFSWSYRALHPPTARLFRLLGLHPGSDTSVPAAASLAGLSVPSVAKLLTDLVNAHLVEEHSSGRYALHDLLRAYAAGLVTTIDSDADRREAQHRLLDYYLHTAHSAAALLARRRDPLTLPAPRPGVVLEPPEAEAQATEWLGAERHALLAAIEHAVRTGFDSHAWQLAWALVDFLESHGYWHDWVASQMAALRAAQRLGQPRPEALAHQFLGRANNRLGRYDEAERHLRRALQLFGEVGDQTGEAHTHHSLALVAGQRGRHRDALDHAERSLDLFRAADHKIGQARAHNAVGWYLAQLGDHRRAMSHCELALAIHRRTGNAHSEAATWDSLGYIRRGMGEHVAAVRCYERALGLLQGPINRHGRATILTNLGDAHRAADDLDAARSAWREAVTILDELNHPDADGVRARLL